MVGDQHVLNTTSAFLYSPTMFTTIRVLSRIIFLVVEVYRKAGYNSYFMYRHEYHWLKLSFFFFFGGGGGGGKLKCLGGGFTLPPQKKNTHTLDRTLTIISTSLSPIWFNLYKYQYIL